MRDTARSLLEAFDAANELCGRYFLPLVWLITALGFAALYLRVGRRGRGV